MPRPEVGRPLPRAEDAYVEHEKWHGYVLADDGHGARWRRVFRVERSHSTPLWEAIAALAATEPVTEVRLTRFGTGCGMRTELTFNGRTAIVLLGWFYDRPDDPPRLVTAYPAP